jgi:hypothetical protein
MTYRKSEIFQTCNHGGSLFSTHLCLRMLFKALSKQKKAADVSLEILIMILGLLM